MQEKLSKTFEGKNQGEKVRLSVEVTIGNNVIQKSIIIEIKEGEKGNWINPFRDIGYQSRNNKKYPRPGFNPINFDFWISQDCIDEVFKEVEEKIFSVISASKNAISPQAETTIRIR